MEFWVNVYDSSVENDIYRTPKEALEGRGQWPTPIYIKTIKVREVIDA
jgi:hypothetical protein